ncbi:hypothetical protein [Borrelia sp. RT1S]|uniref:hypothetical protein n=1 Tax=Borrelia sp. RT1S TaxID=2898580 RepID=UPI001E37DD62|nr:hypothetical protein [Borrelia sp. RT1S]UGQ17999.1 hypothetical protein LSO05_06080 [Borrelia sp. RT1S]
MRRKIIAFLVLVIVLMSCGQDSNRGRKPSLKKKTDKKITKEVKITEEKDTEEDDTEEEEDEINISKDERDARKNEYEARKSKFQLTKGSPFQIAYDILESRIYALRTKFESNYGKFKDYGYEKRFMSVSANNPAATEERLKRAHVALEYELRPISDFNRLLEELSNCDLSVSDTLMKKIGHIGSLTHSILYDLLLEIDVDRLLLSSNGAAKVSEFYTLLDDFVQEKERFVTLLTMSPYRNLKENLCKITERDSDLMRKYDRVVQISKDLMNRVHVASQS